MSTPRARRPDSFVRLTRLTTGTAQSAHPKCHQRAASCTLVTGLESSGTRFVARELANIVSGHRTHWNGEAPPCFCAANTSHVIMHMSLPQGGRCSDYLQRGKQLGAPSAFHPSWCLSPEGRQMLNLSDLLLRQMPHCRAVVLTRGYTFAHHRRLKTHCTNEFALRKEEELGHHVIADSLARAPAAVLLVEYEWFDSVPKYVWGRIARHAGISYLMDRLPSTFRNANLRYSVVSSQRMSGQPAVYERVQNATIDASIARARTLRDSLRRDETLRRAALPWYALRVNSTRNSSRSHKGIAMRSKYTPAEAYARRVHHELASAPLASQRRDAAASRLAWEIKRRATYQVPKGSTRGSTRRPMSAMPVARQAHAGMQKSAPTAWSTG